MKETKRLLAMAALLALACLNLTAQQAKVPDKELVGVWLMTAMQYEGEKTFKLGAEAGHTQVKVYRANGEYACSEVVLHKDGTVQLLPHEYGTYTFKDGKYTEMGRKGILILTSDTTFRSRWKNCHQYWKKAENMPKALVDYIVMRCKVNQGPPAEMQKMMQQHLF